MFGFFFWKVDAQAPFANLSEELMTAGGGGAGPCPHPDRFKVDAHPRSSRRTVP